MAGTGPYSTIWDLVFGTPRARLWYLVQRPLLVFGTTTADFGNSTEIGSLLAGETAKSGKKLRADRQVREDTPGRVGADHRRTFAVAGCFSVCPRADHQSQEQLWIGPCTSTTYGIANAALGVVMLSVLRAWYQPA